MQPMKVTYVVPRYGTQVRGGAETGARMLAERLVAERGMHVEVLTTCALDAITWQDELDPGTEELNGVVVRRIRSEAGRDPSFHPLWASMRDDPERASAEDMERWVDLQGPRSPALVRAVAECDADIVAFYPYLYYPTVRGLPLVAERAVLHPAAHEEAALYLGVFDDVFASSSGFAFHTRSERDLVCERFGVAATPQALVGLGVDEVAEGAAPGSDAVTARAVFGLADDPYLLCIGRVDDQKGTGMLWRYFRAYKERHPGSLRLVFVGQVVDPPQPAPDIVVTGIVDDAHKWGLLRGARALVAPSPHESFSLTVLEGMTAGVPALVNATCGPTREHCERSGGGLWFEDFAEFDAAVELLHTDDALHAVLARDGQVYAQGTYRWSAVLDRYCRFLDVVAGRGGQGQIG